MQDLIDRAAMHEDSDVQALRDLEATISVDGDEPTPIMTDGGRPQPPVENREGKTHRCRRGDALERDAQEDLEHRREAEAVAGREREIRTDGGSEGDNVDTREQIHSGVSITAKVKRGDGTRDQDEIKIKAKGRDAAHAAAEMDAVLEHADGWSEQLRAIQPDDADEGGEE